MPENLDELEPFIGRWRMTPSFVADARDTLNAHTSFEWLAGRRFLIQRWEVEHPDAPDGVAIIGPGVDETAYRQHYFDSRGVERIYTMDFVDNTWTLRRIGEHPDFSQRFIGRFDDDGASIVGSWEISRDKGSTWSHDFGLTYIKL